MAVLEITMNGSVRDQGNKIMTQRNLVCPEKKKKKKEERSLLCGNVETPQLSTRKRTTQNHPC
jgi:hypothetical protein